MPSLHETIAEFVPAFLRQAGQAEGRGKSTTISAAVLFADVSGFTPLAKRLAEHGPEGAEELNRILNSYFGQIVDSIYNCGGDIVRFVGDAVLAIWPVDGLEATDCVGLATACGLEIQRKLREFEVECDARFGLSKADITLSLRINVTYGEIALPQLGGVEEKWQVLIVGKPLAQLRLADQQTNPGEVVLSPEAAIAVQELVQGESLADGHLRAISTAALPSIRAIETSVLVASEEILRQYVPRVVLARLDAGQADFIADLRQVSIVFVQLKGIDGTTVESCDRLQSVMEVLQRAAQQWNGEVYQIVVDDKGTVGILCFGLPHRTSDDNPLRAIRAAEQIRLELQKIALESGVGVATGKIFCGPVGTPRRREYSIYGSVVNLSARLMQSAEQEILCDETTHHALRGKLGFQELPRFKLKGFDAAGVRVFRLRNAAPETESSEPTMIGRRNEWTILKGALTEVQQARPQVVLLSGEPGIGKSALMSELLREAHRIGLTTLEGQASSIERMTPYFAWREVFQQLLELRGGSTSDRAAKVYARLESLENQSQFAPLLNVLLELELPENEVVRQLSDRARAERLNELLLALLEQAAKSSVVIVALEDLQWFDSASWILALLVAQHRSVSLVISSRPIVDAPAEYEQLLALSGTIRLNLESLDRDETHALLQRTLGRQHLSPELVGHLHERAQGNPLFVEELARYLRDAGRLFIEKGVCQMITSNSDEATAVPDTILGVITSRIDQLSPQQQLTLKTASVVGRSFAHLTVQAVFPVERDRSNLDDVLHSLRVVDMIRSEQDATEPSSLFRHVTIHDVAYRQLPRAQRKSLHTAVAQWYESVHGNAPATAPLLAHHWSKAEEPAKAIHYLTIAGYEAIRMNANVEAVQFYEAAIHYHRELWGEQAEPVLQTHRGSMTRQLAEARFRLGQITEARADLEAALSLLGNPVAQRGNGLIVSTARELLIQSWRLMTFPWRRLIATSHVANGEQMSAQESALALQRLSQIHYFTAEFDVGLNRTLRALNLEESLENSPSLGRSYANMCMVAATVHVQPLARYYARHARRVADRHSHLSEFSYVLSVTSMYYIGVGSWDAVQEAVSIGIDVAKRLGDQHIMGEMLSVEAVLAFYRGRFADCLQHFEHLNQIGKRSGNMLHQAWGTSGTAVCRLRAGYPDDACRLFEDSFALFGNLENRAGTVHGLLAYARARQGRISEALKWAATGREILARNSVTTCAALEGYAGLVDAYLLACENGEVGASTPEHLAAAQAMLRRFARYFPVGQPRMLRCAGTIAWLHGAPRRAQKLWRRSLKVAERFTIKLDMASAHYEIGRHAGSDALLRRQHLQRAIRLFGELGVPWELAQANCAMSNLTAEHDLTRTG